MSVFPFAVNGLSPLAQILTILFGHKLSYTTKITGGFICIAGIMIALPLVTNYCEPDTGFWICMIIMVFYCFVAGVTTSSVFGLGGMLPQKYMGAVMFGNGIAGIGINLIRAIIIIILPPNEGNNQFNGTIIYFTIACVILLCAAGAQLLLKKNAFAKYYIFRALSEKAKSQRRISGIYDENQEDASLLEMEGAHINKS